MCHVTITKPLFMFINALASLNWMSCLVLRCFSFFYFHLFPVQTPQQRISKKRQRNWKIECNKPNSNKLKQISFIKMKHENLNGFHCNFSWNLLFLLLLLLCRSDKKKCVLANRNGCFRVCNCAKKRVYSSLGNFDEVVWILSMASN